MFIVSLNLIVQKNPKTRRHLTEYTHIEAEMPFIEFEDLLNTLEDLIVDVCQRVMDMAGDDVKKMNPKEIKF